MVTINELQQKPTTDMELRWQAIDKAMSRVKKHLRPLFIALIFEPREAEHPWFKHLASVQKAFLKSPSISQMTLQNQLLPLIPKRLKP